MFDRSNKAGTLAFLDAEGKTLDVRHLQDEKKAMADKLHALRAIRALKLSHDTIRRIHNEGFSPGRKLHVKRGMGV
jgi:hypothetical protein